MEINGDAVVSTRIRYKKSLTPSAVLSATTLPSVVVAVQRPLSSIQSIFIKDYYVSANFYIPNNLDFKLTVWFLVWFLMPNKFYKIKTISPTSTLPPPPPTILPAPSTSILLAISISASKTILPSQSTETPAASATITTIPSVPTIRLTTVAEVKIASTRINIPTAKQRMQNHWYPLYSWRYMTTRIMEIFQVKFWFALMLYLALEIVAGEIILRIDPLGKRENYFLNFPLFSFILLFFLFCPNFFLLGFFLDFALSICCFKV